MDLQSIKNAKLKMILAFSIPSIIAMVLTSMITIIDGFFVGNYIGKDAIAAINLGLPIIYLFLAIGLMVSVGGISIAGRLFGSGDIKGSNNVFRQTMVTVVITSVALSALCFIFFKPILWAVGATRKNISSDVAKYFSQYYLILLFELPLLIINSSSGMFIRGEGNPALYMKMNIVSVLLNFILDYIFTVKLGFGVSGIAIASLISAAVVFAWNILFFAKFSKVYKFGAFKFEKDVLRNTIFNGSSECIGEMSMCISMFAYNLVIMKYIGLDGIAAFTIVGYVSYLFSMVIVGFGQGIVPLVSFSYGAKDFTLAKTLRKITNALVVLTAFAIMILMFFISPWYSSLFAKDSDVTEMVHSGLLIYMLSFPLSGINTIVSFYFTSCGKAKESAIISSARGLVILLIAIFTLPPLLGITGVWLVGPITECATIILSLLFISREKK